jgi:hypothetical protein
MTSLRKLFARRIILLALLLTALATSMALLQTSTANAFPGPGCCSYTTVTNYYSDASKNVWVGQCVNYNECVGTNTCTGHRTSYFTTTTSCCTNCKS